MKLDINLRKLLKTLPFSSSFFLFLFLPVSRLLEGGAGVQYSDSLQNTGLPSLKQEMVEG